MPEPMTAEQIAQIRERREKATQGPCSIGDARKMGSEKHGYTWFEVPVHVGVLGNTEHLRGNAFCLVLHGGPGATRSDLRSVIATAQFIAEAFTDVPALLAEVERQAGEIKSLADDRDFALEANKLTLKRARKAESERDNLTEEIAALKAEADRLLDFMLRRGYVPCDIPACNCGMWHGGHAERRLNEVAEVVIQADLYPKGNTILGAVQSAIAERDRLRADYNTTLAHCQALNKVEADIEDILEASAPEWTESEASCAPATVADGVRWMRDQFRKRLEELPGRIVAVLWADARIRTVMEENTLRFLVAEAVSSAKGGA